MGLERVFVSFFIFVLQQVFLSSPSEEAFSCFCPFERSCSGSEEASLYCFPFERSGSGSEEASLYWHPFQAKRSPLPLPLSSLWPPPALPRLLLLLLLLLLPPGRRRRRGGTGGSGNRGRLLPFLPEKVRQVSVRVPPLAPLEPRGALHSPVPQRGVDKQRLESVLGLLQVSALGSRRLGSSAAAGAPLAPAGRGGGTSFSCCFRVGLLFVRCASDVGDEPLCGGEEARHFRFFVLRRARGRGFFEREKQRFNRCFCQARSLSVFSASLSLSLSLSCWTEKQREKKNLPLCCEERSSSEQSCSLEEGPVFVERRRRFGCDFLAAKRRRSEAKRKKKLSLSLFFPFEDPPPPPQQTKKTCPTSATASRPSPTASRPWEGPLGQEAATAALPEVEEAEALTGSGRRSSAGRAAEVITRLAPLRSRLGMTLRRLLTRSTSSSSLLTGLLMLLEAGTPGRARR